ncbi:hypothetical protein L1987_02413 [Smallanthus sonchifolius]|uniref:Uncharacterized protein n=1 Tax=Smallanthus sonchifolius TaxID=185202 RepID=A0ACB9K7V6_9ASTR|nr:hypothetical protein L1987_02413 [Smallanthus sonchifolius]
MHAIIILILIDRSINNLIKPLGSRAGTPGRPIYSRWGVSEPYSTSVASPSLHLVVALRQTPAGSHRTGTAHSLSLAGYSTAEGVVAAPAETVSPPSPESGASRNGSAAGSGSVCGTAPGSFCGCPGRGNGRKGYDGSQGECEECKLCHCGMYYLTVVDCCCLVGGGGCFI